MAITHTFVSAVADGADATKVRKTDWNATHTLAGALLGLDVTYADAQAYWMFPWGIPFESGVVGVAVGSNNLVDCVRLFLPIRITVDRIIWRNGTGSGNIGVAFYDSAGTTRELTTGGVAGVGGVQNVNVTNTTLEPGFHWLAWTADNTTNTFAVGAASGSAIVSNELVVQAGTAANASSSGAPPTTLGTITSADVGCLYCKIQS